MSHSHAPSMIIWLLYWVITLACWGYALKRGGAPALWAFVFFISASLLSMLSTWPMAGALLIRWRNFNVILFGADTYLLIGLYLVALKSKRYWPIWATGFQLLCVLTHFGPFLDPSASPKIYRALETMWALPMMISMVLGIAKDKDLALTN